MPRSRRPCGPGEHHEHGHRQRLAGDSCGDIPGDADAGHFSAQRAAPHQSAVLARSGVRDQRGLGGIPVGAHAAVFRRHFWVELAGDAPVQCGDPPPRWLQPPLLHGGLLHRLPRACVAELRHGRYCSRRSVGAHHGGRYRLAPEYSERSVRRDTHFSVAYGEHFVLSIYVPRPLRAEVPRPRANIEGAIWGHSDVHAALRRLLHACVRCAKVHGVACAQAHAPLRWLRRHD
mmetsp:Transcript_34654/g.99913  ORF Transcript_34654/g.99913 Transcript_34654/m.99913 type:complete len:232 (+) Transcript_34654:175-870(+)